MYPHRVPSPPYGNTSRDDRVLITLCKINQVLKAMQYCEVNHNLQIIRE